jgi:glycosyltransferase involved in cell wall biosynthesis
MVFPARGREPFGLVLIEAMACGTPIAALRAGAVPELVPDGHVGVLCDRPDQLAGAIEKATRLDPRDRRAHAERNFGAARMTTAYEKLSHRLLS